MVSTQIVQPTDKSNNLALIPISSKSDIHYPQPATLKTVKQKTVADTEGKGRREKTCIRTTAKLSQCHKEANIHIMYR